jgi:hypothetical protein
LGHSTGGLLAQMLAGGGLSAATVAIDPGVFRACCLLPASALKVSGPFLINPLTRSRTLTFGDEVSSVEAFDSVIEAHTVMNNWKDISNHQRPHSSHGWRTPAALAATVTRRSPAQPTPTLIAAAGPTKGGPSPGSLLY